MDGSPANNRFDKAVKTAMVSSAQSLGLPAAQGPSSSSTDAHTQSLASSTPKPASSARSTKVADSSTLNLKFPDTYSESDPFSAACVLR